MYFIPKNIKVKREIFKGFGLFEIFMIGISFIFGFIFQSFFNIYKLKIFSFAFLPIITFLLLLPLPNGTTLFNIFKKFFLFNKHQKKYKYKN